MSPAKHAKPPSRATAMVFVDPYWMGSETGAVSAEMLAGLVRGLSQTHAPDRVYLYQESGNRDNFRGLGVPVTIRPCASDNLDDGFELIRTMDQDMQQIAAARACDHLVVVSMDDRLALSVERIKSYGPRVIGVSLGSAQQLEGTSKRMALVFDDLLHLNASSPAANALVDGDASVGGTVGVDAAASLHHGLQAGAGGGADALPDQASKEAIESAVHQWLEESDEISRDSALEFVNSRRGLPKHVDSRLLFLCSKALGRELTEAEKIALRGRFRRVVQDQSGTVGV